MKTHIISFFSTLLVLGGSSLQAQDNERAPGGNRQRPDFFALSDKDKNGSVSLDELVNYRIEMMSQRGGQGGQRGEGQAEGQRRGGGDPEEMATRIKEQLGVAFKEADKDKSGELSKEEFASMPQGRGARGGQGGQRGGPRGPRGDDA